jgi:hypothetical protein
MQKSTPGNFHGVPLCDTGQRHAIDRVRQALSEIIWKCWPAAGTNAVVNWRDYGRSRWQLCNHVTNLAECLKRGATVATASAPDVIRPRVRAHKIARWWHCQHDTSSDLTPLARMLPRVIGSLAVDRGRVLIPGRIPWPLSAKAAAIADMF